MIRVVLADDEKLIRSGWAAMLSLHDDIAVVGEASDGREAVEAGLGADVVLMDVRMPRMDGLAATQELARRSPATRVVVVTTFENDQLVWGALRAGAAGYVLKRAPASELVDAVRLVHSRDAVLFPDALRRIAAHHLGTAGPPTPGRVPGQGTSGPAMREPAGPDLRPPGQTGRDLGRAGQAGRDLGRAGQAGRGQGPAGHAGRDLGRTGQTGRDLGRAGQAGRGQGPAGHAGRDLGRAVEAGRDLGRSGEAGRALGRAGEAGRGRDGNRRSGLGGRAGDRLPGRGWWRGSAGSAGATWRVPVELTPRELDVLRQIAHGQNNAEIAAALYVSKETVKTHVRNVLDKLGARDRTQAAVLAYELGLVFAGAEAWDQPSGPFSSRV
ncbi:response regulator [Nonomuraea sp. NPDC004354]